MQDIMCCSMYKGKAILNIWTLHNFLQHHVLVLLEGEEGASARYWILECRGLPAGHCLLVPSMLKLLVLSMLKDIGGGRVGILPICNLLCWWWAVGRVWWKNWHSLISTYMLSLPSSTFYLSIWSNNVGRQDKGRGSEEMLFFETHTHTTSPFADTAGPHQELTSISLSLPLKTLTLSLQNPSWPFLESQIHLALSSS